jgi:hypothetical protein
MVTGDKDVNWTQGGRMKGLMPLIKFLKRMMGSTVVIYRSNSW